MAKLNLITNGIEQEKIKEYLENNASETLAEKINNGIKITKDNKALLSKKDLTGFWKYATEEARKIAEKGARGAYVDDNTVYGWAIHYFEEDSIEGTLYNEDGTEYKPAKPVTKTVTKTETKPKPAPIIVTFTGYVPTSKPFSNTILDGFIKNSNIKAIPPKVNETK